MGGLCENRKPVKKRCSKAPKLSREKPLVIRTSKSVVNVGRTQSKNMFSPCGCASEECIRGDCDPLTCSTTLTSCSGNKKSKISFVPKKKTVALKRKPAQKTFKLKICSCKSGTCEPECIRRILSEEFHITKKDVGSNVTKKVKHSSVSTKNTGMKSKSMSTIKAKETRSELRKKRKQYIRNTKAVGSSEPIRPYNIGDGKGATLIKNPQVKPKDSVEDDLEKLLKCTLGLLKKQQRLELEKVTNEVPDKIKVTVDTKKPKRKWPAIKLKIRRKRTQLNEQAKEIMPHMAKLIETYEKRKKMRQKEELLHKNAGTDYDIENEDDTKTIKPYLKFEIKKGLHLKYHSKKIPKKTVMLSSSNNQGLGIRLLKKSSLNKVALKKSIEKVIPLDIIQAEKDTAQDRIDTTPHSTTLQKTTSGPSLKMEPEAKILADEVMKEELCPCPTDSEIYRPRTSTQGPKDVPNSTVGSDKMGGDLSQCVSDVKKNLVVAKPSKVKHDTGHISPQQKKVDYGESTTAIIKDFVNAIMKGNINPLLIKMLTELNAGVSNPDDICKMASGGGGKASKPYNLAIRPKAKSIKHACQTDLPRAVRKSEGLKPIKLFRKSEIFNKLRSKDGMSEILRTVRSAIKKKQVSPSVIQKMVVKKKRSTTKSKEPCDCKPMVYAELDKNEILARIGACGGNEEIMKKVRKAVKKRGVSPKLLESILNKNEQYLPVLKKECSHPKTGDEIIDKLETCVGRAEIMSRVRKAIEDGKVSASLIDQAINHNIPLTSKKGKGKQTSSIKILSKTTISKKLKKKRGRQEIVTEVFKVMKSGNIPPTLIKQMLTERQKVKRAQEDQEVHEVPPCEPEDIQTKGATVDYPMDKESIIENLTTKVGKEDIIKQVRKAIQSGRVSASLLELIADNPDIPLFKKRGNKPMKREEILAKLDSAKGKDRIAQEFGKVIKKNKVTASIVDMVINKEGDRAHQMDKYELFAKLGTKDGNYEILREVRKVIKKGQVSPMLIHKLFRKKSKGFLSKKLCRPLTENEIIYKMRTSEGKTEVLKLVTQAIVKGEASGSIIDMILNGTASLRPSQLKRLETKAEVIKPPTSKLISSSTSSSTTDYKKESLLERGSKMSLTEIVLRLATTAGERQILKKVAEAIRKQEVTPSLINMIVNRKVSKKGEHNVKQKGEIGKKLDDADGKKEIIGEVSKAIKKGKVPPAAVMSIVNKDNAMDVERRSCLGKLDRKKIKAMLATEAGELQIIKEIEKAIRRGFVSPSLIQKMIGKRGMKKFVSSTDTKTLDKCDILAKLGSKSGEKEILAIVDKAIQSGLVSPSTIQKIMNVGSSVQVDVSSSTDEDFNIVAKSSTASQTKPFLSESEVKDSKTKRIVTEASNLSTDSMPSITMRIPKAMRTKKETPSLLKMIQDRVRKGKMKKAVRPKKESPFSLKIIKKCLKKVGMKRGRSKASIISRTSISPVITKFKRATKTKELTPSVMKMVKAKMKQGKARQGIEMKHIRPKVSHSAIQAAPLPKKISKDSPRDISGLKDRSISAVMKRMESSKASSTEDYGIVLKKKAEKATHTKGLRPSPKKKIDIRLGISRRKRVNPKSSSEGVQTSTSADIQASSGDSSKLKKLEKDTSRSVLEKYKVHDFASTVKSIVDVQKGKKLKNVKNVAKTEKHAPSAVKIKRRGKTTDKMLNDEASDTKSEILKNVRQAVEKGYISPAAYGAILASIRPQDTKAQLFKKIKKEITKKRESPAASSGILKKNTTTVEMKKDKLVVCLNNTEKSAAVNVPKAKEKKKTPKVTYQPSEETDEVIDKVREAVKIGYIPESVLSEVQAKIKPKDTPKQTVEKVRKALKKRKVPLHIIDSILPNKLGGDKAEVLENIRKAVERGQIAPAAYGAILAHVSPKDTTTQVIKKARKEITRRHVTPSVIEDVLTQLKSSDDKVAIMNSLTRAVERGKLPQPVVDEIRASLRPSDTKEETINKIRKVMRKKKLPTHVIDRLVPKQFVGESAALMEKIGRAIKTGILSPTVYTDVETNASTSDSKSEVIKKVRKAIAKRHVTPSVAANLLKKLQAGDDSSTVMKNIRRAVDNGELPAGVMDSILSHVLPDDDASDIIKKVRQVIEKKKLSSNVLQGIDKNLRLKGSEATIGKSKSSMRLGPRRLSLKDMTKKLEVKKSDRFENKSEVFKNIRRAVSRGQLEPEVLQDITSSIRPTDKKSDVIKKVRSAIVKRHVSTSAKDDILAIVDMCKTKSEVFKKVRKAVVGGKLPPEILRDLLVNVKPTDDKLQTIKKVRQAIKKRQLPPRVMDDMLVKLRAYDNKSEVIKNVRKAVNKKQLSPAVMDDVQASVRPSDNASQVLKKVRKAIAKRHVSPSVKEELLADARAGGDKSNVMRSVRKAVEKGRLPADVMKDIIANIRPNDSKSVIVKKVSFALEKKQVPPQVMDDIVINLKDRSDNKSEVLRKIRQAVDHGQIAPAVMDEILLNVRNSDNKSQVIRKIRKAVAKQHVSPSVMDLVLADALASTKKSGVIDSVKKAVKAGDLPPDILDDVLVSVTPFDDKATVIEKVQKALKKRKVSPLVVDDIVSNLHPPLHSRSQVVKRVRGAAVKGQLSSDIVEDILADVRSSDTQSTIKKLIRKAVAKKHVTPSVMDKFLSDASSSDDASAIVGNVRKAVDLGQLPPEVLHDVLGEVRPTDSKAQALRKVRKVIDKKLMSHKYLDEMVSHLKPRDHKGDAMRNVRAAVEKGQIAPAVLDDINKNIRSSDTKTVVLRKVQKAVGKRHVSPSIVEQVCANVRECENKSEILKKLRKAVDKGKLPKLVLDDILVSLLPSDNKEEVLEKIEKVLDKDRVSSFVMDDVLTDLHSSEKKAEAMKIVRKAVEKGQLVPEVLDEILVDVGPEDNQSQVMQKVHKAVVKQHVSEDVMEKVIKKIKASKNKAQVIRNVRKAVDNGQLPPAVLNEVLKDVKWRDGKEVVLKKVQKAVEKRQISPYVLEDIDEHVRTISNRADVMDHIAKAVGKGQLSPAVLEDIHASVKAEDTNSVVLKKVQGAIERRHVTSAVAIKVMNDVIASRNKNQVLQNVENAVRKGLLPPAVLDQIHADVLSCNKQEQAIKIVRAAIEKNKVPPKIIKDIITHLQPFDNKAEVVKNVRKAVERNELSPVVMEDVIANIRPRDRPSQIMQKVKTAVAKRHVTPSVMDLVLADVAASDDKSLIIKHVKNAVKKGQLPSMVMDDIVTNLRPHDTKEEVIKKVREALEDRQVSPQLLNEIGARDNKAEVLKTVCKAVEKGELSPAVVDDIVATVRPGDNKEEVMKKVQTAIAKKHVRPSIVEHVMASVASGKDKAAVMANFKTAVYKGDLPSDVLKDVLKEVTETDNRSAVLKKVRNAVAKRKAPPHILDTIATSAELVDTKDEIVNSLRKAVAKGKIAPEVMEEVQANVRLGDSKSQVLQKVRKAIGRKYVEPAAVDVIIGQISKADNKSEIIRNVRKAVLEGQIPPAVMDDFLTDLRPGDSKPKVIQKVRKALEKRKLSPIVMDNVVSGLTPLPKKEEVMKNIQKAIKFGHLAPVVLDEIKANARPGDNNSQVMKKVRAAIAKNYVTPTAKEKVLAHIKAKDKKPVMIKKLQKAVAKGQVPQAVFDEVLADITPSDTKGTVMKKILKAIEKRKLPSDVMHDVATPNATSSHIMKRVFTAMQKRNLSPSVTADLTANLNTTDHKSQIIMKVRKGVEKGKLTPSTIEILRNVDETKTLKDMNTLVDELEGTEKTTTIMKKLKTAVEKDHLPQSVLDDVNKSVKRKDKKVVVMKQIRKAVRKRQILPKIAKIVKSQSEEEKNENIAKLTESDMKMIDEAAKDGEISESIMQLIKSRRSSKFNNMRHSVMKKMRKNKNKTQIILDKRDVYAYLTDTDIDRRIIRRVRKAIKKGEITPSVMKLLLDKDNTGLIFSDEIIRGINLKKKNVKKIARSKSLKNTAVEKPLLKQTQSEWHTDSWKNTLKGIKNSVKEWTVAKSSQQELAHKQKFLDGMPEYNTKPVFSLQTRPHMITEKKVEKVKKSKGTHPCKCGSLTCRKKIEKMTLSNMKLTHSEAALVDCVCGSNICGKERKKLLKALEKAKKVKMIRTEQENIKIEKFKKKIARRKRYEDRLKFRQESKKRRKRKYRQLCHGHHTPHHKLRKQMDIHAYHDVQKSRGVNDMFLLAASLIDVGRIGFAAVSKVLKGTFGIIRHPFYTCEGIVTAIRDPCFSFSLRKVCDDQSLYVPAARIRHRCRAMRSSKAMVKKMEANETMNYIIHAGEKHPKKFRHKKRVRKRTKPPKDYGKSLYMASRKVRPCSFLYHICPALYPKLISVVNVWKQLCHILFFLIAFIVWSPCLLCMEVCRVTSYLYCPFCMTVN